MTRLIIPFFIIDQRTLASSVTSEYQLSAMSTFPRQAKRPFQPSITSFFGRRDSRDDSQRTKLARSTNQPSSVPVLPDTVQSSLLNVGMRIRKSVPEGYKNRAEARFQPDPARDQRLEQSSSLCGINASTRVPMKFSELAPFCGIHKIGGHAVQPASHALPYHLPDLQFDDDGSSAVSSSQGSQASTISSESLPPTLPYAARSQKRRFDDEDEDDDCEPVIFEDSDMHMMHSRVDPASHTSMPARNSIRPVAHSKTRRKHHVSLPRKMRGLAGQENAWSDLLGTCTDFDEADFLHPPSNEHLEVEMGGL